MLASTKEVDFFSGYYQKMYKGKIFKLLGIILEKKCLKYEISEKQMFEMSAWVKKCQNYFSNNACLRKGRLKYFSCNEKMRQREFI